MGRLLRRAWRYLVAALSGRLDELSGPKIQIEQAIEEAKQQHALLSQQAAAVIGNERELQLKLTRSLEETEKLQTNARQALLLADQARKAGDERKAASYEDSARAFASKLVSAEASMKELHTMHDRAAQASEQARSAVESNAMALQTKLAERTRLLSQLDQAKMQERTNEAMASMTELAPAGDTPTLAEVRDKIESRYALVGFCFPPEVIVLAVRWYLRFGLSDRDVEELLAERGIESTMSASPGGCCGARRCWPRLPDRAGIVSGIAGRSTRPT